MSYKLSGENHQLIHVLRFLMKSEGRGVLDRQWEVRSIWGGIAYPYRTDTAPGVGAVFPEFEDKAPFQVSGERLVERVALVFEFEAEIVRLCDDAPDGFDLLFYVDDNHPLIVETSDAELYLKLMVYFDATSGETHPACFS